MYPDKITTYIDDELPVDAIYLDFRKAFDRFNGSEVKCTLNWRRRRWIGLMGRVMVG